MKLLTNRNPMTARTDSLPDRSLLSGKGNKSGNILHRLSERSLVRKIYSSIRSNPRDEDGDHSISTIHFSCDCALVTHHGGPLIVPSYCSDDHSRTGESSETQEDDECVSLPTSLLPVRSCICDAPPSTELMSIIPPLHRKELVVEELLGLGTFSQVYAVSGLLLKQDVDPRTSLARHHLQQATDKGGDRLVVKHLNRKLLRRPKQFYEAALHLEQEATILSQLEHPHIVRLRAVALGGILALQSGRYNDYFLVLDRLTDTLEERIIEWNSFVAPGLSQKVQYAQQLASALAYLHEHRLVFRDVKPQNVGFLAAANGRHDRLQLFDFGFCRALPPRCFHASHADLETFHMSLAGTTRYMAPEMMSMDPTGYNCKVDSYSWALTVYEMIAQEKPYADVRANHFQELICHCNVRPNLYDTHHKYLKYVPTAIKEVLEETWCASLNQRLSMAATVERLTPILDTLEKPQGQGEPLTHQAKCIRCCSTTTTTKKQFPNSRAA